MKRKFLARYSFDFWIVVVVDFVEFEGTLV